MKTDNIEKNVRLVSKVATRKRIWSTFALCLRLFAFGASCPARYAYYDYDSLPESDIYSRDTMRLLYRVLLRLRPQRICIIGCDRALADIVSRACPYARQASVTEADMLIVANEKDAIAAQSQAHLLILPPLRPHQNEAVALKTA